MTVIAANVKLAPAPGVRVLPVRTAAELASECEQEFGACDALLMAAAVADFRPSRPAATKLKKDHGTPTIELEPTTDVLSSVAQCRSSGQILVGFAEHGAGAI